MTELDIRHLLCKSLPRLAVLAMRMTGDKHDADDLVQRTCVRALEQPQPSLTPAPFTWLYSVLYSIWTNETSANKIRARHSPYLVNQLLNKTLNAARTPECIASDNQILKMVELLPDVQKSVVILLALEGFTYSETAESLNIPIGTVMSRFSRARTKLIAELTDDRNHVRRNRS